MGLIKPWEVGLMMAVSTGVLVYSASQLNTLALVLSPVAAAYVVVYSYTKYFTWVLPFRSGLGIGHCALCGMDRRHGEAGPSPGVAVIGGRCLGRGFRHHLRLR